MHALDSERRTDRQHGMVLLEEDRQHGMVLLLLSRGGQTDRMLDRQGTCKRA